jgi:hypothetical protein
VSNADQGPVTNPGSSNGRIAGSEPADTGSSPVPGIETRDERTARLRGLKRLRPLTFERLVQLGRITAEDLELLSARASNRRSEGSE